MDNKTARQDLETVIRVEDLALGSMRKLRAIQDWLRAEAGRNGEPENGAGLSRALATIARWERHLNALEPQTCGDAVDLDMHKDDLEHLRELVCLSLSARQVPKRWHISGSPDSYMRLKNLQTDQSILIPPYFQKGNQWMQVVGQFLTDLLTTELEAREGWKLVPKNPTPSMCEAGFCVPNRNGQSEGDWMSEIYLAMLDAAPKPPTAQEGE